jgi:uncharacterized protein (DUF2236 family)
MRRVSEGDAFSRENGVMDEPLFGPDSMMWRINRESILLIGGRATLLMQLAHPLVAAGVADHSNFRTEPLKRLGRTLDVMLAIVFGTREQAERVAAGVNRLHQRVRGVAPDGRPYAATDPRLLLWVHATLVDSAVRVYEACVRRLTEEERARFYEETTVVARLFNIPKDSLPNSLEGLRAWMRTLIESGEVAVTPPARELAESILKPIPFVPRRVAWGSAFVTAALLPPELRDGYGLGLGRPQGALLEMGRRTSRVLLPLIPTRVRSWPAARLAERTLA